MYYMVLGSNLHGQWFTSNNICMAQVLSREDCDNNLFNINEAKLLSINWSYNIFQWQNAFYISGSWLGREQSVVKVQLPEECDHQSEEFNYLLVGNDYKLFLINSKKCHLWTLEFENFDNWNWEHKPINFDIETFLNDDDPGPSKRQKAEISIIKAVVANRTVCFLTSVGSVFEFPNKLNTSHCIGKVCDIDYGHEHGILMTDAGHVYTWGTGGRCQLGHGGLTSYDHPTEINALAGIKMAKIKAGGWHSLAVSDSGDLYTWGWNDSGQLGIVNGTRNDLVNCALPTVVDIYDDEDFVVHKKVIAIACGSRHSAILLENRTLYTSGLNRYGQLGFSRSDALSVDTFSEVIQCGASNVMCGPWSTVLQTTDPDCHRVVTSARKVA